MKKYIIDKEIELSNENDLLKTKVYSNSLIKAIDQVPKDKAFTIGVFGEWGSGKSSIIKTAQKEIEARGNENNKFIIYDAWKYANDSFRRMFLLKICNDLKHQKADLMESFYSVKSKDTEVVQSPSYSKLVILFCVLVCFFFLVSFFPLSNDWKIGLRSALSLLGIVITIGFKLFDEVKVKIQTPYLFAPEQFEECFGQMMNESLKKHNLLTNLKYATQWILKGGENYIKDLDRLVIVVDNIDRCHKDQAYELLTNMKNFLSESYSIIFLIPVDDKALKRHLFNDSLEYEVNEKEEFLRKFFNSTIRIKQHRETELGNFVEKLNDKHDLKLKPDTINLLGSDYATNPRRIIQLINNLSVELNNYDPDFASKYETVICVFLVIREEWEDYYNIISKDVSQFNNFRNKTLVISENEKLDNFLNTIKPIMNSVDDDVIRKILTNSDASFSDLPEDLINAIKANNYDEINKALVDEGAKLDSIIDYLIDYFKQGINGDYRTKIENGFKLICKLSNESKLPDYQNNKITPLISKIVLVCTDFEDNHNDLVKYSLSLKEQGSSVLERAVINKIRKIVNNASEIDIHAKKLFLLYSSLADLNKLNKDDYGYFSNALYQLYQNGEVSLDDISELNLEIIVDDKLLNYIISRIDFNGENSHLKNLIFISKTIDLEESLVQSVFEKANSKYLDFNNLNSEKVTELVTITNSILENVNALQDRGDESQFKTWYRKIYDERYIVNEQYKDHPNSQTWLASPTSYTQYVDEAIVYNDVDEDLLIKLSYEAYKTTLNNVVTIDEFELLLEKWPEKTLLKIEELKKEGFILFAFKDLILNIKEYNDVVFSLFKHFLIGKKKNNTYISSLSDLNKIDELYNDSKTQSDVMGFLVSIKDDERIKDKLVSLISSDSHDEIMKLDSQLWSLISDEIKVFDEFKDNMSFVKAIAKRGSKTKIREVVRVIIHKLNTDQNLDEAIEITNELNYVNSSDSKKIISTFESFETETETEKIKEVIAIIKSISK